MKNLKDFKEFSVNEEYDYYSDFDYLPRERRTKLARKLDSIRSRVKAGLPQSTPETRENNFDAVNWLSRKLLSGVLGIGAAASDLLAPKKSDKDLLAKKDDGNIDVDKSFDAWKSNLGPTTTEKDLEEFAERSQKIGYKKFGRSFDYNHPAGEDQKKYADLVKQAEEEMAKRMKR